MEKVGKYEFFAMPFHCDYSNHLMMSHLGNYMLNAADFHSRDRGFGFDYLFTVNKAWVLSRLAIEVEEMPEAYERFYIETWVENAMRFFTKRNFRVVGLDGKVFAYGRSVWAMIDTETRQPQNLIEVKDGAILQYIEKEKECPIADPSRVQMDKEAEKVRTIYTYYSDVDLNGHINSVKYIEHVLDLFPLSMYKENKLKRFEIAYPAESHQGDKLNFYQEQDKDGIYKIKVTKSVPGEENETETVRSMVKFVKE